MRIDKYLWCVRLAKTRSLASKLVDSDKVLLNGAQVKPSKEIKLNDSFSIRENPSWRTYKCVGFPKSRVGAKLLPDYLLETTSEEDLKSIQMVQEVNRQNRFHGIVGRPTKRLRRDLDRFKGSDS